MPCKKLVFQQFGIFDSKTPVGRPATSLGCAVPAQALMVHLAKTCCPLLRQQQCRQQGPGWEDPCKARVNQELGGIPRCCCLRWISMEMGWFSCSLHLSQSQAAVAGCRDPLTPQAPHYIHPWPLPHTIRSLPNPFSASGEVSSPCIR